MNLFDASKGDFAGAGEVGDAEGFHEFEELVDFAFVAGEFDGEIAVLHVDDFRAENIADLHDFGASRGIDGDAKENEFAIHILIIVEILDVDHLDQFVELFGDLFEHGVVAPNDNGHARGVIGAGADVERIDIEASTAEHTGYACENAEFIFDENRDGVAHKKGPQTVGRFGGFVK